jgi:hypothetical protein
MTGGFAAPAPLRRYAVLALIAVAGAGASLVAAPGPRGLFGAALALAMLGIAVSRGTPCPLSYNSPSRSWRNVRTGEPFIAGVVGWREKSRRM